MRIVVDTHVFVSALLGGGAANAVVAECLRGRFTPLMGPALIAEHEAQLGRAGLFEASRLSQSERLELFDILAATCRWTRVYYGWRPNLRDEGDNHVIELAVAGNAQASRTFLSRPPPRHRFDFLPPHPRWLPTPSASIIRFKCPVFGTTYQEPS